MAEILPEDSGVIRCICNFDHDDNFTIQCERCNAWQHATCVGINNENAVPDNYTCPECNGTLQDIDSDRARTHQRHFLQRHLELQKQSRQAANDEEHEEERRRRPGRKRNVDIEAAENKALHLETASLQFDSEYFVVPSTDSVWTPKAEAFWSQVIATAKSTAMSPEKGEYSEGPAHNVVPPVLHSKELKSPPQLRITRHKIPENDTWRFGVEAGALTSTSNLSANKFICEVVGEVMLRTEYTQEPTNQFARLGCPKPGVLFAPGLNLAIDTRRRGSQYALFLRRTSEPNAKLVTRRDSRNNLRILVYSRKPIKAGAEISLGWHWPAHHPIREALYPSNGQGSQETVANGHEATSMLKLKDLVKTALWLLDTDASSCRPCDEDDGEIGEDWEVGQTDDLTSNGTGKTHVRRKSIEIPPKRLNRAEELLIEENSEPAEEDQDEGSALSIHIYVPAPHDIPPPPKKRMSLMDYMKKRGG